MILTWDSVSTLILIYLSPLILTFLLIKSWSCSTLPSTLSILKFNSESWTLLSLTITWLLPLDVSKQLKVIHGLRPSRTDKMVPVMAYLAYSGAFVRVSMLPSRLPHSFVPHGFLGEISLVLGWIWCAYGWGAGLFALLSAWILFFTDWYWLILNISLSCYWEYS